MLYTATEVAEQINATKPDFKHFKELFTIDNPVQLKTDFDNTTCVFQKILKAQIICCYRCTHPRFWVNVDVYANFLFSNTKDMGLSKKKNFSGQEVIDTDYSYYIKDSFNSSTQVAGNLTDVQNYIPNYLWDRIRTKSQVEYKQLKPDGFSLATFKNYLKSLKKEIPSSQAINYLEQVNGFPLDIKQQYIEVIVEHLSQPSWKFQECISDRSLNLANYFYKKELTKFKHIGLSRYHIKNLVEAHSMLVPQSVMDSQDSAYKPFITGIKRKPTADTNQFTALVGTLIVLKTVFKQKSSHMTEIYEYFIEEIEKHLKDPAYDQVKAQYAQTLKNTKESIEEILNGFI